MEKEPKKLSIETGANDAETLEKEQLKHELESIEQRLGLDRTTKTQTRAISRMIDVAGVKNPNRIEEQYFVNDDCIVGYLAASDALSDFKRKNSFNYLSQEETFFLLNVDELKSSDSDKNYYLMQIHDRFRSRLNNDEKINLQLFLNNLTT